LQASTALASRCSPDAFIADFDDDDRARKATIRFLQLDLQRRRSATYYHKLVRDKPYFSGSKCRAFSGIVVKYSSSISCANIVISEKNEWDNYAHGLVGNLSGIEPQLTPCARLIYDTEQWPVISVNSVFQGTVGYAARKGRIQLVSLKIEFDS
jgi:hypothetical protein